jgi:hypothetical protein
MVGVDLASTLGQAQGLPRRQALDALLPQVLDKAFKGELL